MLVFMEADAEVRWMLFAWVMNTPLGLRPRSHRQRLIQFYLSHTHMRCIFYLSSCDITGHRRLPGLRANPHPLAESER
ncbi:uncharacterized [Tachysurus ichikawai]